MIFRIDINPFFVEIALEDVKLLGGDFGKEIGNIKGDVNKDEEVRNGLAKVYAGSFKVWRMRGLEEDEELEGFEMEWGKGEGEGVVGERESLRRGETIEEAMVRVEKEGWALMMDDEGGEDEGEEEKGEEEKGGKGKEKGGEEKENGGEEKDEEETNTCHVTQRNR